jgi:hypothetical protein
MLCPGTLLPLAEPKVPRKSVPHTDSKGSGDTLAFGGARRLPDRVFSSLFGERNGGNPRERGASVRLPRQGTPLGAGKHARRRCSVYEMEGLCASYQGRRLRL